MHKLNVLYEEKKFPSIASKHQIVEKQGRVKMKVINVLKLANNNELPYLQDKVEFLRNGKNNLELEKAE